jgi:hypothetical protein
LNHVSGLLIYFWILVYDLCVEFKNMERRSEAIEMKERPLIMGSKMEEV